MELSSCLLPMLIEDSSLADWQVIGSGGFGQIYKARHHQWCCDVAIKLLHYDNGNSTSLLHEIDMMRRGSNPHVIHVLGVFKGRPPYSGPTTQLGLVMEVMERGSLASLQDALCETPPWPLVFRLAHQVALGINFLHSLSPALLHLDLKPSNVLLDSGLNAKLTDFGLARLYRSVSRVSKKDSEKEGGTNSYMPPEAFDVSYSPTKASDIYSYGILLWSIVTGKQPYAREASQHSQGLEKKSQQGTGAICCCGQDALSSIVRFRIPQGDRPSLDEIRSQAAVAGLNRLMDLMERCWDARPHNRPSSHECTTVTEELYKMHKHAVVDAVAEVQKKLDRREEENIIGQVQRVHITEAAEFRCGWSAAASTVTTRVAAVNACDDVPTGGLPIQEMAGGWAACQRDSAKDRVKDLSTPAGMCNADLGRSVTDHKVKVSSVHPIRSTTPPTGRPPQGRTANAHQQAFRQDLMSPYQRQFSSPDTFPCHPPPAAGGIHIHLSNVTGFQQGKNNTMHIYGADPFERRRHPTAPSRVDIPPPH